MVYDGADLEDVAARWGTDAAEVAARHGGTEFVSAFCGFAPGFAYLSGLPDGASRAAARHPAPPCPGGVGRRSPGRGAGSTRGAHRAAGGCSGTPTPPSGTPTAATPALLAPGTRVRFVPA